MFCECIVLDVCIAKVFQIQVGSTHAIHDVVDNMCIVLSLLTECAFLGEIFTPRCVRVSSRASVINISSLSLHLHKY